MLSKNFLAVFTRGVKGGKKMGEEGKGMKGKSEGIGMRREAIPHLFTS